MISRITILLIFIATLFSCRNSSIDGKKNCVLLSKEKNFPFQIEYPCDIFSEYEALSSGREHYVFMQKTNKHIDYGLDPESELWGIYNCFYKSRDTSSIIEVSLIPIRNPKHDRPEEIVSKRLSMLRSSDKKLLFLKDTLFSKVPFTPIEYEYLRKTDQGLIYYLFRAYSTADYIFFAVFQHRTSDPNEIKKIVYDSHQKIKLIKVIQ